MPQHSFKKFVRGSEPPGNCRLQARDSAILRDLADCRLLNTEQIVALYSGGLRNLQRRLRHLYRQGYVERPSQQTLSDLPSQHIVYSLGRKGAELVFADTEERAEHIRQIRLNSRAAFPSIAHSLMISQFRVVLSLALRKNGDAKIIRWKQDAELKHAMKLKGEKPTLIPDAFFTIEDKDGFFHFFLEADRSTMTNDRFLKKMQTYWNWWQNETYNEKLGISRFRVLTITLSKERKENLKRTTREADPRKQGSAMFLFACEKDYSLSEPENVLKPIWLSPKDDLARRMME